MEAYNSKKAKIPAFSETRIFTGRKGGTGSRFLKLVFPEFTVNHLNIAKNCRLHVEAGTVAPIAAKDQPGAL